MERLPRVSSQLPAHERVVEFDPTGTLLRAWGLWVSDTSYNRLVEFRSTGGFIQAVGYAGSGNMQFNHPAHLDVDADTTGHVFLY